MTKAKILSIAQMKARKFKFLPDVPEIISRSFGALIQGFVMIIYGHSGQGKSNLIVQLLKVLTITERALYISIEEGHGFSMQQLINRHLGDEYIGKIAFADHTMTYEQLWKVLKRKRSFKIVVIDSVQYWNITYEQYFALKTAFPNVIFLLISHAEGVKPKGSVAKSIEFDASVKVRVEKNIAFIVSRLGGNNPYVIWEEGAKAKWGSKYYEKSGLPKPKAERKKKVSIKPEEQHVTADSNVS